MAGPLSMIKHSKGYADGVRTAGAGIAILQATVGTYCCNRYCYNRQVLQYIVPYHCYTDATTMVTIIIIMIAVDHRLIRLICYMSNRHYLLNYLSIVMHRNSQFSIVDHRYDVGGRCGRCGRCGMWGVG